MSIIPDSALDAHIAIVGTTGGGKSYTARGIAERLLSAQRRVCILDPVGVWWGLRANTAGDGPGYAIAVIGGDRGDLPLSEGAGKALGELVARNNFPCVIDTSEIGEFVSIAKPSPAALSDPGDLNAKTREAWISMLGGRPAEIIQVLARGGRPSKIEIAEELGCAASGGHWNRAWKILRENDLVRENDGRVSLMEDLA